MSSPSTEQIRGRSLELYFIDGKPDGLLTAEVFNWTGHVLMSPRTQIAEALKRNEARRTGVYILLGESDGVSTAYIGEAEEVGRRLKDHAREKDWWTSAVMITTASDGLHKAHVKYLESRLVEIAKDVSSVTLENGNIPPRPSLHEAHISNMEFFLDTLLMVLPAIRVDMFLNKKRSKPTATTAPQYSDAPVFELTNQKHGLKATARLEDGEFIVQEGSMARLEWSGDTTDKTSYWKLFQELVDQGVLIIAGDHRVFATDYAFSSTSAAGAIVNGRSSRGPTEWKVKGTSKTYRDWEIEQLNPIEPANG